jgi:hypothetical protein
VTINLMESELHINWKMIYQILEDLGKKKIYMKFVPQPQGCTHSNRETEVLPW